MARAKVFGKKGQHVFRRRTSTTDHITAHLCVCADGRFLPSFVIFQGSLPHRNYKDRVPDNWLFAYSESGYMDRELFNNWFTKIFLPHCGRERPVVLILDNHDTHVSISLIKEARANRIILVGLPAHTTHILQPLDVKIIGPLKERYCSMAANLGQTSTNMVIGKARFPLILKYAIDKSSPDAISEAFAVTGVHPFNPEAIDKSQLITPTLNNDESPDNISTPSSACPTCGSYLTNPLVVHGLIPTSLANILVPPPAKPKQQPKNRRIVTSARILSGEEMLQQLKEREILQKKKIEERNNRKIEMEKKRQEKQKLDEEKRVRRLKQKEERMEKKEIEEKNKKQRKLIREERKAAREHEKEEKRRMKQLSKVSMEEIAAAREYVCNVRGIEGTVFDEANGIQWYGCDEEQCKRWYHDDCLTRPELEMVLESLEDGGAWYCRMCKPWMYEEE